MPSTFSANPRPNSSNRLRLIPPNAREKSACFASLLLIRPSFHAAIFGSDFNTADRKPHVPRA